MKTEEWVFRLLRAALFGEPLETLQDWESVFAEMKAQTVAALAETWLKEHPIAGAEAWEKHCLRSQAQWLRVMNGQAELLKLLEGAGIPCVILKGAAAAMAYPQPRLRAMGDVDFLVKQADFERAAALLEENGYQPDADKELSQHHYAYSREKLHYELHRRLGILREDDMRLIRLFEDGIDRREWRTIGEFRFPVMPEELNGLSLMTHINQHLRSGLGLRQIIDWMMYLNALPEKSRIEKLQPLLEETGMARLAKTVTLLCQQKLGLRKIVEEDDDCPVEALTQYIMEKGNFGRKAGFKGHTESFVLVVKGPVGFFRRLQLGGLCRWEAARKHRALRPFAWLYQAGRITGIVLQQKVSPKSFARLREKGLEQRKLIEALGLNEDLLNR